MKKLQTGDKVKVIAWKFKGEESVIQAISGDKVYLKGVYRQKKAVKGQWFVEKEGPIHLSNVAAIDEDKGTPSKIGFKIEWDKKVRYTKKSGAVLSSK